MSIGDMSLREKSAWITLISVVLCFGVYYSAVFGGLVGYESFAAFHLALGCILALIVLQGALSLLAARLHPKEARSPRDEREQLIQSRSHTVGYYVLMLGMAAVLISTHIPMRGRDVLEVIVSTVNLGILAMVIAGLSVSVAQIVMFRRGA